uniref:Uncharacterized protein LOC114333346 n=1 Tax=Diabrotica virgifera virgifera TaxID=50390 RepID=A0A6P7G326_DIAVI
METKTRIYKSPIRPIMTYTAETRADTAKTQRLLETAEMKVLRKITNHTLKDRVRSEEMRTRCVIEEINIWKHNIGRMTENRIVRIARDKSPNGTRSLGRSRKRWSDNVN